MSTQYVVRRDPDSTWSVREILSGSPAVVGGARQVGLGEDLALIRAKKLNTHIIEVDDHQSSRPELLVERITPLD